ncbi:MAG TPA: hypothetical protein VF645_10320 [Allosphingosinicella sp.]|jgi:hypothetical protein
MQSLFLSALLAAAAPAAEEPQGRLYLLSIGGIELGREERVTGFGIASWGVDWVALCRIPTGWRLRAGRDATSQGLIEGESTHGATRLGDLGPLREIALVRLWGPVQARPKREAGALLPATFAGSLTLSGGRRVKLDMARLRLSRAKACPAPAK